MAFILTISLSWHWKSNTHALICSFTLFPLRCCHFCKNTAIFFSNLYLLSHLFTCLYSINEMPTCVSNVAQFSYIAWGFSHHFCIVIKPLLFLWTYHFIVTHVYVHTCAMGWCDTVILSSCTHCQAHTQTHAHSCKHMWMNLNESLYDLWAST